MTKFDRVVLYAVEIYALAWIVAKLVVAAVMIGHIVFGSAPPITAPHGSPDTPTAQQTNAVLRLGERGI